MAAVDLTVIRPVRTGVAPSAQTGVAIGTTDQYFVANDGAVFLRVSDGAALATMTIVTYSIVDGLAVPDRTVAIPTGAVRYIGPFPPDIYNDSDRKIQVSFAADDASLVLEALSL